MKTAEAMYKSMVLRAVSTILIFSLVLISSILFVAFFAGGLSLLQDIAIIIVAFIAATALICVLWIVWWIPSGKFNARKWR